MTAVHGYGADDRSESMTSVLNSLGEFEIVTSCIIAIAVRSSVVLRN